MGRKEYADDLATAEYLTLPNIKNIHSSEDGEFTFTFATDSGLSAKITAMLQDVSEYPKSHEYMLFASEDAPIAVTAALENAPSTRRKTIPQLLDTLARHLKGATATGGQDDAFDLDNDDDITLTDPDPELDEADFDDEGNNEDWLHDDDFSATHIQNPSASRTNSTVVNGELLNRIRSDLLIAKVAGFKVGAQGQLSQGNSCYVSISCRIEKLGISQEAMQTWGLHPSRYLCLMLYYPAGYKDLSSLTSTPMHLARRDVTMRVGLSDFYKPRTLSDAQQFFKPEKAKENANTASDSDDVSGRVENTFISGPMDTLLNERLLILISFRLREPMSWWGAERYYNETQGMHISDRSKRAKRDYNIHDPPRGSYPHIVMDDELASVKAISQLSFPLVAMQFLLRHFVRCTEFCLVCHTRLDSEVEAIKPYVCDNPLCLFQYMTLGFGPSIEHEILAQPLVVDVLISFCYTSVLTSRIRELPKGLGWSVPHPRAVIAGRRDSLVSSGYQNPPPEIQPLSMPVMVAEPRTYRAKLNRQEMQLLFDSGSTPVSTGNWIAINIKDKDFVCWHCRVDAITYPTVWLSKTPIMKANAEKDGWPNKENVKPVLYLSMWEPVEFSIYDTNFDDISDDDKHVAMILLMDLMPSVKEMREYLRSNPGSTIAGWHGRMTEASVGLLRWIIASNRSCIMQIDEEEPPKTDARAMAMGVVKGEQRIAGLDGWLQFRFAMGAPDKEQRFIDSLSHAVSAYPSLFAWHGSPLANWHSIIREGLNFKETMHGRAYGNGCYHASDWQTSTGYSGMALGRWSGGNDDSTAWPSSTLQIRNAVALSEIVNAPSKFQNHQPYYVVQYVDWIQTRYLFVQPSVKTLLADDVAINSEDILPQDPTRIPQGPHGPLQIPAGAIPKSRRPGSQLAAATLAQGAKSSKKTTRSRNLLTADNLSSLSKNTGTLANPIDLDGGSVMTLDEDRMLLSEPARQARPPTPPLSVPSTPLTPYHPGTIANLPTMPAPTYATPKASMSLQKAFREVQRLQDKHLKDGTLWELGWYLDQEHFESSDNLYQWIIHMHSFPLSIPLGRDMQDTGINAITFELRFSANYPFAPPFLRVIRPRFLPFHLGGGGHVTAGGSVCMDLLTSSGWMAAYSIDSILLQVRMALMSTDPRPARLQCAVDAKGGRYTHNDGAGGVYGEAEAVEAFERACRMHGWEVPAEIRKMMSPQA